MQNQHVVQVNIKSLAIVQTKQKCVLVTHQSFLCLNSIFSHTEAAARISNAPSDSLLENPALTTKFNV